MGLQVLVLFSLQYDVCILIYLFSSLQIWYVKTKHTVFYYYIFIVTNDCSKPKIELKLRVLFLYNWYNCSYKCS